MAFSSRTEVDFEDFFSTDNIDRVVEKAEEEILSMYNLSKYLQIKKWSDKYIVHCTMMHQVNTTTIAKRAHEKLDLKVYWKLVSDAAAKFSHDCCYSSERNVFGTFSWTNEEAENSYQYT